MKQYCRYCGSCCEGDCYYCSAKDKVLTEKEITKPNNCRDYGYCGMDIITGKVHKAKFRKEKSNDGEQLQIGGMI